MTTHTFTRIALIAGLLTLAGCASVSVRDERWTATPQLPKKIYVAAFADRAEGLRVDREGADLEAFRRELREDFAAALAERLTKSIAPAEVLRPGQQPEPGTWLLDGEFTRVDQGSRALRSVVGWGLGGTKFEVASRISVVAPRGKRQLLAEITTTGGSNAEPGALFVGPFTAVPRLALVASLTGVTADARRTARVVVAALSERLTASGYQLPGSPLRAKRLGSLPGAAAGAR